MPQVFEEHAHLRGEQRWQEVFQGAHTVARDMKCTQNKWNSRIRGMEEALQECRFFKLRGRAKEILAEKSIEARSAREAYQQLC